MIFNGLGETERSIRLLSAYPNQSHLLNQIIIRSAILLESNQNNVVILICSLLWSSLSDYKENILSFEPHLR